MRVTTTVFDRDSRFADATQSVDRLLSHHSSDMRRLFLQRRAKLFNESIPPFEEGTERFQIVWLCQRRLDFDRLK